MDARQRGVTAAAAGNGAEAEAHYRRAINCYRRAGRWSPTAPLRMWPFRARVWHDLAKLYAQQDDPAAAERVAVREVIPVLSAAARVRPRVWQRPYAAAAVDVAEWAYAATNPALKRYVTRARQAAEQAATIPPPAPVDDMRLILRTHVIDVYVLEDRRQAAREVGDEETLKATDRAYAAAIGTAADQYGEVVQKTDKVSDWAVAAQLAGIAYRHHHRIGEKAPAVRFLRSAIHRGERYLVQALEPQASMIEAVADWLTAAVDNDPEVTGNHAATTQSVVRSAALFGQLPRTHQTAAHAAGLYATACEQHDQESTRLHKLAEKEQSDEQVTDLQKQSGTEFTAAARCGRYAIDLYSEAHHLVEQAEEVTDADDARRLWIELELELVDRMCDITKDLVGLGIAGAEQRLVEVHERAVSVANLAWRLLPDRRPTTAPRIARILRDRARHLIETASRDPAAYGNALDYAMDATRVEQAHPPTGGPRRSHLLAIAYGLIAASELQDAVATEKMLEWWTTTHTTMVAAGRRLEAAEVANYLQQRLPELAASLADPIPDTPGN